MMWVEAKRYEVPNTDQTLFSLSRILISNSNDIADSSPTDRLCDSSACLVFAHAEQVDLVYRAIRRCCEK